MLWKKVAPGTKSPPEHLLQGEALDHMHQHRATLRIVAHILQHRHEVLEIMAVDRADIIEAHFLKPCTTCEHRAAVMLGLARGFLETAREQIGEVLRDMADVAIFLG